MTKTWLRYFNFLCCFLLGSLASLRSKYINLLLIYYVFLIYYFYLMPPETVFFSVKWSYIWKIVCGIVQLICDVLKFEVRINKHKSLNSCHYVTKCSDSLISHFLLHVTLNFPKFFTSLIFFHRHLFTKGIALLWVSIIQNLAEKGTVVCLR